MLSILKYKKIILIPFIVILLALLAASHTIGYNKGKSLSEQRYQQYVISELEKQKEQLSNIHSNEIRILMESKDAQVKVIERIREVKVFVDTPCDDLGDDWLHEYNQAIHSIIQHPRN